MCHKRVEWVYPLYEGRPGEVCEGCANDLLDFVQDIVAIIEDITRKAMIRMCGEHNN